MVSTGLFTTSDLTTISKAAGLAERLTEAYFNLAPNEWKENPYTIFTHKQVGKALYEQDVFAHVVRYERKCGQSRAVRPVEKETYGVVLQDPNILLALLRSAMHNLWTLGLFILTHELTHIIRFKKHHVDFFAPIEDRDKEEKLVHEITQEILSGVTNTDYILSLYEDQRCGAPKIEPSHTGMEVV